MKKLLLVLIIILFNSCATILSGTRERILVNSNKVGDIFINGDLIGNTTKPFTINKIIIKKKLVLEVDGFQDKRIELKRKFNSLSLIGVLFPISLAIDIITGAILNFDRNNYLIEYSDLDYIKSGLSICGKDIDKVNLYDLREMVKIFICDCEENGIIFKENEVMITSEILDSGTVAISKGMYNDNQIQIQVDAQQWKDATPSKKWYILYHELGHDLLNLEHGNGGEMMYNYEKPDYSWNEWIEAKDYMLMSYKNNK